MIVTSLLVLTAFATPPEATKSQDEYAAKLTAAEPTADAQYRLATWARQQGMKDVADGHLRAAVHTDSNHALAQKALGRVLRDGRWETKEERAGRLLKEESLRIEFATWNRRLNENGFNATFGQPMTDSAIAAVEAFASSDVDRSLEAVKLFSDFDQGTATLALLRLAVGSEFPNVRRVAAKSLSTRNPDHYLLTLLDYARPQRAGREMMPGTGEIWYWQQGSTMFTATPPPERVEPIREYNTAIKHGTKENPGSKVVVATRRVRDPVAPDALESAHATAQNVRTNALAALRTATGLPIGDDFQQWRTVVMQLTGNFVDSKGPKAEQVVAKYYQTEEIDVGIRMQTIVVGGSCFAAGTPVVAKRGVVPIDQVCIGELVLSRNVESGETAFKPVLARTLRPRVPMRKLAVGDETLLATAGHPFWTPEKGWTKTKNLSQGLSLGGEDGAVKLSNVADAEEPQQAYNLVVADFGTYFVGKSRLLVHDNTPIRDAPAKAKAN